jgi:diguanylate cyclase (GGDEF)-like protein
MRLTSDRPSSHADTLLANRRVPPGPSAAIVGVALALVFVLDHFTRAVALQHLYYIPIIVAGVRFGFRGSTMAATAAVLLYHLANPHLLTFRYGELDLVQIALFVAVGLISAKLAVDARRLHRLAVTDDLTGLHNLRSFEARLRGVLSARDGETPIALLVLDVDRLKSLNDAHGHLAGADAVRTVGHIVAGCLPAGGFACRYGGDEFVIALPRADESRARHVAEDLRRAVNACAPVLAGTAFEAGTLSISVGIACGWAGRSEVRDRGAAEAAGEELFRAADAALYTSKRAGRNRVSADERAAGLTASSSPR